jgi:hypothetical protein
MTISQRLVVLGAALVVSLVPTSARAEEIKNMLRYYDANGVAHYVGNIEQVPPEYRASAKAPDSSDQRMPPVTSVGNDLYGRQTYELEYKRRREEREKQLRKLEQEYRASSSRRPDHAPNPPPARRSPTSSSASGA